MNPADQTQTALPAPAGTDENGQPYWLLQDRKVTWGEMQQYLWQLQQQAPSQSSSGKGGIENMPVPVIDVSLNSQPQFESGPRLANPEKSAEKRAESTAEQSGTSSQPSSKSVVVPQEKAPLDSLIGDSPRLKTPTNDAGKMQDFYLKNGQGKGNPKKSNTFLAALFGKILRTIFSLNT